MDLENDAKRLVNACNGLSEAQGGMNLPEMRAIIGDQGSSRKDVIEKICTHAAQLQGTSLNPGAKVFVPKALKAPAVPVPEHNTISTNPPNAPSKVPPKFPKVHIRDPVPVPVPVTVPVPSFKPKKQERAAIASYHSQVKYAVLKTIDLKPNPNILDLACGRGGDLFKYTRQYKSIRNIIGVDIDPTAVSEAVRRVKEERKSGFIKLGTCDVSDFTKTHQTIDRLSHGKGPSSKISFDLIVCNFAVHYFFKTERALDNFIKLVKRYIVAGTYIWVVCPDGDRLKSMLREQNPIANDAFELSSTETDMAKIYGGNVDFRIVGTVYFESATPGAQIISDNTSHEYFTNIDVLIGKCREIGCELIQSKHFDEFMPELHKYSKDLTPDERRISSANISLMFQAT
jgi:SAM-dependent methyltransferase